MVCGKILEHSRTPLLRRMAVPLPLAPPKPFSLAFPPINIIKELLGPIAYPLFPAFRALNRAVLTLTRGVLTPGLPHAYPVPEVRLPRHVPPCSCISGQRLLQPCE